MPDGDTIYGTLHPKFQKLYIALCEGVFDVATIAHDFVDPMRDELKKLGDAPLQFLIEAAPLLRQIPVGLLSGTIDYRSLNQQLEQLARAIAHDSIGTKRGIDLALESVKKHITELRQNIILTTSTQAIVQTYIQNLFEAEFVERIPLGNHPFATDKAVYHERLFQTRPYLKTTFASWAEHAIRTDTFTNFHTPSRRKLAPVTATTDLLALT